jgi:antigen flippase
MGGSAGINLLMVMVRMKFAAVLIGTAGVGLIASFTALLGLIGTLAGLGLQSSAVRDIAKAISQGDDQAVGRSVCTLRRLCWLTGLMGMAAMVLLSPILSQLTFGHSGHILDIAALGFIILFGNLSAGQMALIQGTRRIGDLARANIYSAIAGTVAAICFYATLGMRGIVPTLVVVSVIQLALSWYFARRVPVPNAPLSWRQTLMEANGMVRFGLVMMWSGLMGSAVAYITIILITQHSGPQAVGLYSAAFALSGMFVNFVLGAMGADYYPRLTGAVHDKQEMVRLVNEQTEIGLLLALPGLLATMVLAQWILQIFYAHEFLGAVELLQWFILGCLGRVISWPMGYIMLAMGKSIWIIISESIMHGMHILLIFFGFKILGLVGVALSFVLLYVLHILVTLYIARKLISFSWSNRVRAIILLSVFASTLLLFACFQLEKMIATLLGITTTVLVSLVSVSVLLKRTRIYIGVSFYKKAEKFFRH